MDKGDNYIQNFNEWTFKNMDDLITICVSSMYSKSNMLVCQNVIFYPHLPPYVHSRHVTQGY